MRHDGRTWVVATGTVFFVFIGGSSAVTAVGGGPSVPVGDLERAGEAALEATGGSRVIDREVGDQRSAYEIEVILDDGRHLDVRLDASFAVVAIVPHAEAPG
jgi:hypothetical protein